MRSSSLKTFIYIVTLRILIKKYFPLIHSLAIFFIVALSSFVDKYMRTSKKRNGKRLHGTNRTSSIPRAWWVNIENGTEGFVGGGRGNGAELVDAAQSEEAPTTARRGRVAAHRPAGHRFPGRPMSRGAGDAAPTAGSAGGETIGSDARPRIDRSINSNSSAGMNRRCVNGIEKKKYDSTIHLVENDKTPKWMAGGGGGV